MCVCVCVYVCMCVYPGISINQLVSAVLLISRGCNHLSILSHTHAHPPTHPHTRYQVSVFADEINTLPW